MPTKEGLLKEKLDTINRLLEDDFVLIHLDSSIEGVVLPAHLYATPSVTLKLSRHFRGNMQLDIELIEAELLFGSNYFTCKIPLTAVWGVTSMKGANILWPESTPEEILEKMMKSATENAPPAKSGEKRPQLKRVK